MTERDAVGGEYSESVPLVVAVGSASRDLTAGDPRGWRLGGGVTYGALALARAGVPVGALIGVDGPAAGAWELDLLRAAGAHVRVAPLASGPVFENQERSDGRRRQVCHSPGAPVSLAALPAGWRGAAAWLFAPVAGELPVAWAGVPSAAAHVALGWQGLLRHMRAGAPVGRRAPGPTPLLARADLVGVSTHDLPPGAPLVAWASWLGRDRPEAAELVVTVGHAGGIDFRVAQGRLLAHRRFPAIAARHEVDPTGAGDVFLAVLLAARLATRDTPRRPLPGASLAMAAAAASLAVEGLGVTGVPTLAQMATRLDDRP